MRWMKWSWVLPLVFIGACSRCPETPDAPEAGTYEVTNADELPVTILSVVVVDQLLTIRFLDDGGAEQYIRYRIQP